MYRTDGFPECATVLSGILEKRCVHLFDFAQEERVREGRERTFCGPLKPGLGLSGELSAAVKSI